MISIFTLVGLMTLKQAYICGALLIPLAGFVWYFTGQIQLKFRSIFNAPSLTSATDKDRKINRIINKGQVGGIQQFGEIKKLNTAYLPPIMCIRYPVHNMRHRKKRHGNHNNEEEEEDEVRMSFGAAHDDEEEEDGQTTRINDIGLVNMIHIKIPKLSYHSCCFNTYFI
eukprot:TRINITY_DN1151_c0_g1_i1.p1 TRINITY_DN1151_c0_g1~~TRINITY_DN1151_c0_g1_i1.p1  ORF type:complete len:169 (-),score=13.54 TRINITY_DN1151_c0_g1_i1:182-688(-)